MKTKRILACLLAAAFSISMNAAMANGVAFETTLSDVSFRVDDLAPDDGIDAGYAYGQASTRYTASFQVGGGEMQEMSDTTSGLNPVDYTLTDGTSNISVQSNGVPGEISLSGTLKQSLPGEGMTTAYASHSFQLTLDANSQLILSLHILQAIDYLADPSEYYSGNTVFSIEISDPVTGRQSVESRGVQLVGQSNPIFDVDSSVTYANTTDAAVNLEVTFWSSASNHVTTPVPEPSAYAMLVVGLAGMGAVARRQQCRA